MKRRVLSLLALALVGTFLFTGCDSAPAPDVTAIPPRSTDSTRRIVSTQSTKPILEPQPPVINYRPDLVWATFLGYGNDSIGDLYIPRIGTLENRFLSWPVDSEDHRHNLKPEDEKRAFAIYFGYYGGDAYYPNWDALVDYLAERGIEEVGREGGFRIPVFAMTMDQLESLDCITLQTVMEIPTEPYGLDVMLSSNSDKENEGSYDYHKMLPWIDFDIEQTCRPFATFEADAVSARFSSYASRQDDRYAGSSHFSSANSHQTERFDRFFDFITNLDLLPQSQNYSPAYGSKIEIIFEDRSTTALRFTIQGQYITVEGDEPICYAMSRENALMLSDLLTNRAGYEVSTDPLTRMMEVFDSYDAIGWSIAPNSPNEADRIEGDRQNLEALRTYLSTLPLDSNTQDLNYDHSITINFYSEADPSVTLLSITVYGRVVEIRPCDGAFVWYSIDYERVQDLIAYVMTLV